MTAEGIVAVVTSGTTLSLLGVLAKGLYARFKTPTLGVTFDPALDISVQPWGQGLHARWLRISVINPPRCKVAKNVGAYLVDIAEQQNVDSTVSLGPTGTRQLRWTHSNPGDPDRIDLLPGIPRQFDVVTSFENQPTYLVQALAPYAIPPLVPGKTYALTIRIAADNVSPKTVTLEGVICPGNWSTLTALPGKW